MTHPRDENLDEEVPNDLTAFLDAVCARIERDVELLEEIAKVIKTRRRVSRPEVPREVRAERTNMVPDAPTHQRAATRRIALSTSTPVDRHVTDRSLIVEALTRGPSPIDEIYARAKALGYGKDLDTLRSYLSVIAGERDSPVVRIEWGVYALRRGHVKAHANRTGGEG